MLDKTNPTESIDKTQLKSFVERIERVHAEREELGSDLKDLYAELKSMGYDSKIVKKVVSIRKKDKDKYEEENELIDIYMRALV